MLYDVVVVDCYVVGYMIGQIRYRLDDVLLLTICAHDQIVKYGSWLTGLLIL